MDPQGGFERFTQIFEISELSGKAAGRDAMERFPPFAQEPKPILDIEPVDQILQYRNGIAGSPPNLDLSPQVLTALHGCCPEWPKPPTASAFEVVEHRFRIRSYFVVITLNQPRYRGFICPAGTVGDGRDMLFRHVEELSPSPIVLAEDLQNGRFRPIV